MFSKIKQDIYAVFANNLWKNNGIKVYPDNYQGNIGATKPFIRMTIIPGSARFSSFHLKKELSGRLILSIFVDNKKGETELYSVADIIDDHFQGKTLTNGTQFGPSSITPLGIDNANSSLYRGDYSITFKSYGE